MNSPSKTTALAKFEKNSDSDVRVTFQNLESFLVPFFKLRMECPCAGCVDEMTGERTLREERVPKDVCPIQVTPVGNYAIRILWSDGHGTGMYHHETLYKIGRSLNAETSQDTSPQSQSQHP